MCQGDEPGSRRASRRGISSAHDSGAWLAWVMLGQGNRPQARGRSWRQQKTVKRLKRTSGHPVTETPGGEAGRSVPFSGYSQVQRSYRRRGYGKSLGALDELSLG